MTELNTTPRQDHWPEPWLPSFDLHEQDGELVLHADLIRLGNEDVEISLDGGDLVLKSESESARLPLPFAPQGLRAVSRRGHERLEIHIPIPSGG